MSMSCLQLAPKCPEKSMDAGFFTKKKKKSQIDSKFGDTLTVMAVASRWCLQSPLIDVKCMLGYPKPALCLCTDLELEHYSGCEVNRGRK